MKEQNTTKNKLYKKVITSSNIEQDKAKKFNDDVTDSIEHIKQTKNNLNDIDLERNRLSIESKNHMINFNNKYEIFCEEASKIRLPNKRYSNLINMAIEAISASQCIINNLSEQVSFGVKERSENIDLCSNLNNIIIKINSLNTLKLTTVQGLTNLTNNLSQENIQLNSEASVDRDRKEKSKNSTIKRYKYITSVAKEVTVAYAKQYPHNLNKNTCEYGVKAEINRLIIDKFSTLVECKKANLTSEPTDKTANKHRVIAFEILEYPNE